MLSQEEKDNINQLVANELGFDPSNCTFADIHSYEDMDQFQKDCKIVLKDKINQIVAKEFYSGQSNDNF